VLSEVRAGGFLKALDLVAKAGLLVDKIIAGGYMLRKVLIVLFIIGVFALISFVIAGFKYLTSGGDRSKADSAKRIILYSIIAVLVSGSGVIIIRQVFKILEG
jgi:hypothetical protein